MTSNTLENMVLSNTYADLIVPVQTDTKDFLNNYSSFGAQLLGGRIGVLHIPRDTVGLDLRISYSNIPKLYPARTDPAVSWLQRKKYSYGFY